MDVPDTYLLTLSLEPRFSPISRDTKLRTVLSQLNGLTASLYKLFPGTYWAGNAGHERTSLRIVNDPVVVLYLFPFTIKYCRKRRTFLSLLFLLPITCVETLIKILQACC